MAETKSVSGSGGSILPKALEILVFSDVELHLFGQDAPKRLMAREKDGIYLVGPAHIDAVLGVALPVRRPAADTTFYRFESFAAPSYQDASGARFGGVFDLSFLYGEGLGEGRVRVQLHQSMRTLPPSFADYIYIATEDAHRLAEALNEKENR